MLKSFLNNVASHLNQNGEAWLVMSDLAEHLGLRKADAIINWISEAGLIVHGRDETKPKHPKSKDPNDPLFYARSKEITSLWRLKQK